MFHKKNRKKSRFCANFIPLHPPLVWENGQNGQISDQNGNITNNQFEDAGWGDIIKYAPIRATHRASQIRKTPRPAQDMADFAIFRADFLVKCVHLFEGLGSLFHQKCFYGEASKGHPKNPLRSLQLHVVVELRPPQVSLFNGKSIGGPTKKKRDFS